LSPRQIINEYELYRAAFPSIDIFAPVYGFPLPTSFDEGFGAKTTTDNVGIYLQDQVTLLANLKLLIGGRFDFVNSNLEDFPDLLNGSDSETSNSYNEAFSPRVGLVYQPIEPISLYASYTRSFVPNSDSTATGELLEPTRATQYEAGIKASISPECLAMILEPLPNDFLLMISINYFSF
jgi:iron complex outermembrane receptor protein